MELPTYTSIWRIEKRLYKLYDFRLPMPLPVGQIAVFAAITVPYVILLTLFGLPFSHTLFWLYVLPPGVLTWLATRPVLESKRLPELIISQVRYLGEPSAWCRMTPHVEKDEMLVTGRVWRRSLPQPAVVPAVEPSAVPAVEPAVPAVEPIAVPVTARPGERAGRRPVPETVPDRMRVRAAAPGRSAGAAPGTGQPPGGLGNGHGNGHGSAPPAFGAPGRGAPSAPAPAKAPAPASPPEAFGTPAAAAPPAAPVVPASAPASANAPASAKIPASPSLTTGASAPAASASVSAPAPAKGPVSPPVATGAPVPAAPVAPASAPASTNAPAPAEAPVPASPPVGAGAPASAVAPAASAPAPAEASASPPVGTGAPVPAAPAAPASAPASASAPAPAKAPVPASPPAASGASPPVTASATASAPVGAAADAPAGAPAADGPQVPVEDPAPAAAAHAPAAPPPVRETPAAGPVRAPRPPVVVVPVQRGPVSPPTVRPRTVERALGGPAGQRSTNWRDRVVLVPGGVGPGRPDHDKRDRARVVLPVDGSRLVAVLGCTVGAGQTVTTLMVADLLASLRGEAVAALDLNPAPGSLAELAAPRKVLSTGSLLDGPGGPGGPAPARREARGGHPRGHGQLDVFVPEVRGDGALDMGDLEYRRVFDAVAAGYGLTLADPGAAAVARVLAVADQLILVAPASPDAARALAMTQEWLGAHGYDALAANSVTVVNGLSKRSMPHAEQAELVVRGRCRAIVRVPWDDHLAEPLAERGIRDGLDPGAAASRLGQLRPPVLQAYTALAGVLVAALAASPQRRRVAR